MIYIFDETQTMTGVIDVAQTIEAKLTLEINKAGTLDVVLPPKSEFNEKMANAAYLAVPYPNDAQKLFFARLLTRKDEDDRVTYEASEMAYHELDTYGVIEDKRPTDKDAQFYLDTALEATQWRSGVVNVAGTTSVNFYKVTPLQAINSVVEVLGGELVFYVTLDGSKINGCYVDWVAQQGTDTSKTFAHGSNLLTVERQTDRTSVYTAIMPRGKGEEVSEGEGDSPDGYGRRIEIDGVAWSKANGDPLDKPSADKILVDPEATKLYGQRDGQPRLLIQTYDKIEDRTELINAGYKTLMEYNHPQVQYSATVANVGDMQLGDTVVIMHSERSMTYKTRVFKITYDLQNNANTEAEFGDDLTKNDITSQVSSISSSTSTISEQTQWNISNGGHHSTSFSPTEPANPRQGDVWFKELPNGNTEEYYWNGNTWVLGAETDQQWKENQAMALGGHTTFRGPDKPTAGMIKGDVWFKSDNNEPDGKAMYTYDGTDWIKFEGNADASRLQIGTIDASKINVLNLSADNIASGTMSANFIKGGQIDASQVNVINLNVNSLVGDTAAFVKANFIGAYGETVDISGDEITFTFPLAGTDGQNLRNVIDQAGFSIKSNSHTESGKEGEWANFGSKTAGFTTQNYKYGLNHPGITVGDGVNYFAEDMAFGIGIEQQNGAAPQLIWAGYRAGTVTSSNGRVWENPQGWILPENIRFSTWDDTASRVWFDNTVVVDIQASEFRITHFSDAGTYAHKWQGKVNNASAIGMLTGDNQAGWTVTGDDTWLWVHGQPYSVYQILSKVGMI